jgi:hypothetical protein
MGGIGSGGSRENSGRPPGARDRVPTTAFDLLAACESLSGLGHRCSELLFAECYCDQLSTNRPHLAGSADGDIKALLDQIDSCGILPRLYGSRETKCSTGEALRASGGTFQKRRDR